MDATTVAALLRNTDKHPLLRWEVQLQIISPGTRIGGIAADPRVFVTPKGDLLIVPGLETISRFWRGDPRDLRWQEVLRVHLPHGSSEYAFDNWQQLSTALKAAQVMDLAGVVQLLDVTTGRPHQVLVEMDPSADEGLGYIHIHMPEALIVATIRRFRHI